MIGFNMFTYCGNNPVLRRDDEGSSWILCFGIGIATQYAADVVENLLNGKTGLNVFKANSSVGEYIAAGVTAMIPGKGLGWALVRNTVSEGIAVIEQKVTNNDVNIAEAVVNIGIGTILDTKFEKFSDKVDNFIKSKQPHNYSSYANIARKNNPNLTRTQVTNSMRRAIRFNRTVSKFLNFGIGVTRTSLPY